MGSAEHGPAASTDLVQLVSGFKHLLDKARFDVEDLKLRVDRHEVLLRGHASSLMTVEEVEEDAASRRAAYEEVGSCQRAATGAKVFFGDTHTLMRPTVVRGVLYAPAGGLRLRATNEPPGSDPGAVVHGRAYALRKAGGCVWERSSVPAPDPAANAMGHTHYVTVVGTAEGMKVAVDWSLGQFAEVPGDLLLFLQA